MNSQGNENLCKWTQRMNYDTNETTLGEAWQLNCYWKSRTILMIINQIPEEISPEYTLEGLMLKLKLQYLGHLMWRTYSLENTLILGKIEGGRKRGWQRMRWLDGITDSMDISLSRLRSWWWAEKPGMLQHMWSQRVRHDWGTELNWNTWVVGLSIMSISAYMY